MVAIKGASRMLYVMQSLPGSDIFRCQQSSYIHNKHQETALFGRDIRTNFVLIYADVPLVAMINGHIQLTNFQKWTRH